MLFILFIFIVQTQLLIPTKEIDFGFFCSCNDRLLFSKFSRRSHESTRWHHWVFFNFNTVYNFIFSLILFSWIFIIKLFSILFTFIFWYDWCQEFKLSAVQFHIDQFINELANYFPVTLPQVIYLQVFDIWKSKLLQITDHFCNCIIYLSFKILEVYKHTLSLGLIDILN